MIKVFNISWFGLKMHVASFKTYKEAKDFIKEHKDYTLFTD